MLDPAQKVICLGLMDYEKCLEIQTNIHSQVAQGNHPPVVLVVEHPPTITSGYQAKKNSIKVSPDTLLAQGIKFCPSDRGGDVTAHEPGQLVIYPIFNLSRIQHKLIGPKKFVEILEEAIINWLFDFGVQGHIDPDNPGVWVSNEKIAAIGIRIRNRTTYHGIAINLFNDLKTFSWIVPCGLEGKEVTSLHLLTGRKVDLAEVGIKLADSIYRRAILGN